MRTEEEIEKEVARFSRLGQLLRAIHDPSLEADASVRRRLARLRDWGTTTVYPVLLHLLDRRDRGPADAEQIATAMLYLESYFVRRLLIGRATASINRVLLAIVTEMDAELPVDRAVHQYLSTGRKYYATDQELRASIRSIPYYLNGRPNQRPLVLRWLEETYASKEPVDLSGRTIEHVLPQTATEEWRQMLGEDLEAGEEFGQAHEAIKHTLGNLTLTGYNAKLSNSPFEVKRPQLASSGVRMNQEIAEQERWSRPQIHARADALAERVITAWPGPAERSAEASGPAWNVVDQALAALPAGSRTTYGDLAALIGSQAIAVGQRLATAVTPNAHRVLQSDGKVSPNFAWVDPSRTDDPRALLEAEGLEFDPLGRAEPVRRFTTDQLAVLLGADILDVVPVIGPGQDGRLRDRFRDQLIDRQGPDVARAVAEVINAWTALGGQLEYGTEQETSCFLMSREKADPGGNIWPATLYPSGKFEVVFQHLSIRPPFDDRARREELRRRLNEIEGVDLSESKLEQRPGFTLELLVERAKRQAVIKVLAWFHELAWKEQ